MLDDADHLVWESADTKLTSKRVEPREKELCHLIANDDHRRSKLRLLGRENAAAAQIVLLDREVVALDGMRIDLPRPREGRRRPQILAALDRPSCPVRQYGSDGVDVFLIEPWPFLPLPPLIARRVVPEPGKASQRERVGAEDAADEVVLDVAAHPLDDRDDGDQEHDADRHAGEREEAFELLHPDLRQREADRF